METIDSFSLEININLEAIELLKELCITDANYIKGNTLYLLFIAQISHAQAKISSWI